MDTSKIPFVCNVCSITCSSRYKLVRHETTIKHCKNIQKGSILFSCNVCSYVTHEKSDYDKHVLTPKHSMMHPSKVYSCSVCAKPYKTRTGLWKHGRICKATTVEQVKQDPNLILQVMEKFMKQTEDLAVAMDKLSTMPKNVYKTFNLNIFLNETCKDAMNWSDFIKSLNITLADLDIRYDITHQVTHTICEELKRIGVHHRPLHCLDVKRGRVCVKDNNQWLKDSMDVVTHGILVLSNKFKNILHDWTSKNPEWYQDQELTDQYMELVNIYMREPDNDKCMSHMCKQVILDRLDGRTDDKISN